ncbi:MAG: hypothetical protein RMJ87_13430 [Cytophagales bacterium]|nr:hypothetical protein [Bernardetiaceae bacterium]MDW8206023.1 hypothetical protein [Cytophagales bacterium]
MNKNFFAMLAFVTGLLVLTSALYSLSGGISVEGLVYLSLALLALMMSYLLKKAHRE